MVELLKRISDPETSDALPTIRNTAITVEQVHQELMFRSPENLILTKYSDLDKKDIQAVWVYKALQNKRDAVVDLQELISTLSALPKKVSLLQLYDHIDFIFQIQERVSEEKGIPHEQVMHEMKEFITGLKLEKR